MRYVEDILYAGTEQEGDQILEQALKELSELTLGGGNAQNGSNSEGVLAQGEIEASMM